jgi:hypothetical protein
VAEGRRGKDDGKQNTLAPLGGGGIFQTTRNNKYDKNLENEDNSEMELFFGFSDIL